MSPLSSRKTMMSLMTPLISSITFQWPIMAVGSRFPRLIVPTVCTRMIPSNPPQLGRFPSNYARMSLRLTINSVRWVGYVPETDPGGMTVVMSVHHFSLEHQITFALDSNVFILATHERGSFGECTSGVYIKPNSYATARVLQYRDIATNPRGCRFHGGRLKAVPRAPKVLR